MKWQTDKRTLGVNVTASEGTLVTVWAPLQEDVVIVLEDGTVRKLNRDKKGYWKTTLNESLVGHKYKFRINGEDTFPDPCSLYQPDGVHGYSEITDLNEHQWQDTNWRNFPQEDYILYELHVGTFTPEGTFDAVIGKLDYLSDLGVNAIEVMPIAQFPGDRNWGYDGVFPYAVQHSYGGPKAFQRLVDACHQKGIAVVLDVVYNHLGPEGNYLETYAPYFTDKYHTPWGKAVNVDDAYSDEVRRYIVENMLLWFRDFHVDALRLDAVHALKDLGAKHILQSMREHTDLLSSHTGRNYYLIGECDLNDVRYINEAKIGGYGLHGQWIDEFHHALRVSVGEKRQGYYSDFEPIAHLAKSYVDAYVYDGLYSPHRKKTFGNKASAAEGRQFVVFSQNHDQVGNRMLGERSSVLYSFGLQKVMATAVLAAPYLPMLFMGEEYGETQPFQYFVSHTDAQLAEAVRKGRKEEFKDFHGEQEAPDPMDASTFYRSKLNWNLLAGEHHYGMWRLYKTLIALRKQHAAWHTLDRTRVETVVLGPQQSLILNRWDENESLFFFFNFGKQQQCIPVNNDYPMHKVLDTESPLFMGTREESYYKDGITLSPESAAIYRISL
ncbi:malto-oligosyltrehalose trehalohydrolase [Olivibacter sitiensis]|uniref:malto-oligosyltrehalose trehalohydrolase n=1 Tax=Olivibacter sitiensis TaxID=376470 RepID=UPI00041A8FA1|nr:malto-oligosyltrehalose trehalohydrolase [Olivibacter sitiensis]